MNALERALGAIAPRYALRRAKARLALSAIEQFEYDGAKAGRRTGGWIRPSTSATAEIGVALRELRNGARDLVRNNPHAANLVRQTGLKAVGSGILPRAATDSDAINRILDEKFEQWAKELNADGKPRYAGMQRVYVETIAVSGECLLRFRPRRLEDGFTVPLQVQLLEPDWIDHVKTYALPNGGAIIQGVEYDPLGREVAVWLFPQHPGDAFIAGRLVSLQSTRYPVDAPPLGGLVRGFRVDRPGQVHGASWFSPVMIPLYDLGSFKDAERVRKRSEACVALVVSGPEAADNGAPAIGQQTKSTSGEILEELRPGMIARVPDGSTVSTLEPKPAGGYGEYVNAEKLDIAAGWGVPGPIMTGDLSQVNYSSYRGGLIALRDLVEQIQDEILIPGFCDPIWRRFVDACKLQGVVEPSTGYQVKYSTPAFDLLDRLTEAEADENELRIGTMTWPEAVARQGRDPRKQLKEIEEWNAKLDKAGIILDSDPRKTDRRGVVQSAIAQGARP